MPRFRFTVRRMMAAVAIAGAILASTIHAVRLARQSARYEAEASQAAFRQVTARQRAQAERWAEESHRKNSLRSREELAKPMYRGPEWKEFLSGADPLSAKYHGSAARDSARRAAALDRQADYWHARQGRYRRAARYPWRPVAPDPPGP